MFEPVLTETQSLTWRLLMWSLLIVPTLDSTLKILPSQIQITSNPKGARLYNLGWSQTCCNPDSGVLRLEAQNPICLATIWKFCDNWKQKQENYSRISIYLKVTYNLLQLGINKYLTGLTPLIPALTTSISKLKALFTWKVTTMAIYGPCLKLLWRIYLY